MCVTTRFSPFVRLVLLAGLLAIVGGCAVPQRQDVRGQTLTAAAPVVGRDYYVYLPEGYSPARRYPLVVSIHGMKPFDNAYPQLLTWRKICDERGWIAVAPRLRSPDMFYQFPFRRIDNVLLDDETFIVACVQDAMTRYSIEPASVMLTGWSSGGYLVHYVAARHPELFTLVCPQGANFSPDIMPQYVPELARLTPVYIYHGRNDLGVVQRDSDAAARWYREHGYRNVVSDEAPGGHERHPELAARYFAQILGDGMDNSLIATARQAKLAVLDRPWLGRPPMALPDSLSATTALARGPVGVPRAVPPAVAPTTPPARPRPNAPPAGSQSTTPPGNAAIPSVSRVGLAPSDEPGPSQSSRPAPPSQARSERFETPAMANERVADVIQPDLPATPPPQPERQIVLAPPSPGEASVPRPTSPSAQAAVADPARQPTTSPKAAPVVPTLAVAAPRSPEPTAPAAGGGELTPVSGSRNGLDELSPEAPPPVQPPSPIGVTGQPAAAADKLRIVASAGEGPAPLTVTLRAELRNVSSPIVRWRWEVNGRLVSTANFALITLQRPGRYPVELAIEDAAGNTYHSRQSVNVTAP